MPVRARPVNFDPPPPRRDSRRPPRFMINPFFAAILAIVVLFGAYRFVSNFMGWGRSMAFLEAKPKTNAEGIDKVVIIAMGNGAMQAAKTAEGYPLHSSWFATVEAAKADAEEKYGILAADWTSSAPASGWDGAMGESLTNAISAWEQATGLSINDVMAANSAEPEFYALSMELPDDCSLREVQVGSDWELKQAGESVGFITVMNNKVSKTNFPQQILHAPPGGDLRPKTIKSERGRIELKNGAGVQSFEVAPTFDKPGEVYSSWQLFMEIDEIGVLVSFFAEFEIDRDLWLPAIESIAIKKMSDADIAQLDDEKQQTIAEIRAGTYRPKAEKQVEIASLDQPRETKLEFSPDSTQFHLWDVEVDPGPNIGSSDEDYRDMVLSGRHCVSIFTESEFDADVAIEFRPDAPSDDLIAWDQVVDCSIDLPSGRLELDSMGPIAEWRVPPGSYRVRACFGGLDTVDPGLSEGDDIYRIIFWPGDERPVKVLKRWTRR